MARTVVLIHPGALGDVLLALPSIRTVRRVFPRHEVLLCAGRPVSELLHACGEVHGWLPVDGPACAGLFSSAGTITGVLKEWLDRCDLAVAWARDEEGVISQAIRRRGVAEVRVESPAASHVRARHQSDRLLEITGLSSSGDVSVPALTLPDAFLAYGAVRLQERGLPTDRPMALIHPGSGSRYKCVRPEVLGAGLSPLPEQGLLPLILEGPADGAAAAGLLAHVPSDTPVIRGVDLIVLTALLLKMCLFIGHDSGITHLAAAAGIPTVALFGPTDPARWAPRGAQVTVLQAAPCTCESWEQVRQCGAQPCLHLPVDRIVEAGLSRMCEAANPRNTSGSALSPSAPYARVAS